MRGCSDRGIPAAPVLELWNEAGPLSYHEKGEKLLAALMENPCDTL